jgi:Global regulator protein family
MLVLSRRPGESVVIDRRTVATVAVVGRDFVDLCVTDIDHRLSRTLTLAAGGLTEIAHGVSATIAFIDHSRGRARLAFDIPPDIRFERAEFSTEPQG